MIADGRSLTGRTGHRIEGLQASIRRKMMYARLETNPKRFRLKETLFMRRMAENIGCRLSSRRHWALHSPRSTKSFMRRGSIKMDLLK
jgi:hypothetical protein